MFKILKNTVIYVARYLLFILSAPVQPINTMQRIFLVSFLSRSLSRSLSRRERLEHSGSKYLTELFPLLSIEAETFLLTRLIRVDITDFRGTGFINLAILLRS